MPERHEHVAAICARLVPALAGSAIKKVHRTRVTKFAERHPPLAAVYGTHEEGRPRGSGWLLTHTLKIDLVFAAEDGFDEVSGPLVLLVKQALFRDPTWLALWQELPSFTVQQLAEADGERAYAFEAIVIRGTDAATTYYPPSEEQAPPLEGIDTDIDADGPGVDPDDEPDVQLAADVPET